PDRSIDLAFSTIAFHHWADQGGGLREVARVLRPGGGFVLVDNIGPDWLARYLRDRPYLTADERAALWAESGLRVFDQRRVVLLNRSAGRAGSRRAAPQNRRLLRRRKRPCLRRRHRRCGRNADEGRRVS